MPSSAGKRHSSGESPIPIKSSLSVILKNGSVWSNYSSDTCATATSRRTYLQPRSNVGGRGDVKEWSANVEPSRNAEKETLDTFAKCLVQRHKKKRMEKKTQSRSGKTSERRTKKSRQVFTFSRPTNFQPPGYLAARRQHIEGIEIYESSGGSHSFKEAGGEVTKSLREPVKIVPPKCRFHQHEVPDVVPLPRVVPQKTAEVDPYESNSSCDTQIFFPDRLLTPLQNLPETCFPRPKSQPDLYYTISNESLPVKNYTSSHSFSEKTKNNGRAVYWEDDMSDVKISKAAKSSNEVQTNSPVSNDKPKKCRTRSPKKPRTQFIEGKDIIRGYEKLNDFLSRRVAETLNGISLLPTRGRLMNYAKFGSSFKISEDVYEDVNCRSLPGMPKMVESMTPISIRGADLLDKKFGYIHKVNPDFDENQSVTEAFTANRSPYQSSSMTSVALRSDVFKVYHHHFTKSVKVDTSGGEDTFSWIRTPEDLVNNKIPLRRRKKHLEVESIASTATLHLDHKSRLMALSNENIPCITRSKFISGLRKQRLMELKIALDGQYQYQKETDLWSSANISQASIPVKSDPMEMACGDQASRRMLCDGISQTGIFNHSSVELFKRPFWRFKLGPLLDFKNCPILDGRRAKLAQDFVSKAHHYKCGKDYHRLTLNRCYFRTSPAVRSIDQSTQFPDFTCKVDDRLVEIEETIDGEYVTVEESTYLEENYVPRHCTGVPGHCKHSMDDSLNALHQVLETNPGVPCPGSEGCHRHVSRVSFTEINCMNCSGECARPTKMVEESQGLVHSEMVYGNVVPNPQDKPPLVNLEGVDVKTKAETVSHSFRALCDKRRIHIKYNNGKYTVYKEVDRTRRQTVWSLLTGKATNLLSSVITRKSSPNQSNRGHKTCS